MGTYPARAIIWFHADSCPPSPPESNNLSSDDISSCPSVVRIMGVFYHINMFGCIDGVLRTNIPKCIISLILNIIRKNKIDWINDRELFLCLLNNWYHMVAGICRDIGMVEDKT